MLLGMSPWDDWPKAIYGMAIDKQVWVRLWDDNVPFFGIPHAVNVVLDEFEMFWF